MKVALDTNVLAYVEGVGDLARQALAEDVLARLGAGRVTLPSQVAGELYNVLRRKKGLSGVEATEIVSRWIGFYGLTAHSPDLFSEALALAARHDKQIWDALILTIAASAGCHLLLSEDMQDGFVYRGVTVANPFAETPHPLLASLLQTLTE
jgi:predicted nucleic acid-binding protein